MSAPLPPSPPYSPLPLLKLLCRKRCVSSLYFLLICRNADSSNKVAADGLICMLACDCLWLCMVATGHSLGGALATLAAYDIRKQLLDNRQSNTQVVCYTFAAPRTGNHAFARDYTAAVPDTWSVINDQVRLLPYSLG